MTAPLELEHRSTGTLPSGSTLSLNIAERWGEDKGWRQTLSNALIITRREVRDSFRDWRIIVPIFMLTLVFPVLANVASAVFVGLFERSSSADTKGLIDTFLPLMPMLVGFFPVSISLVIALETFVGEKERLSLEPLLSTPLTNTELYIGKVLAAIIPPLAAGYTGITLYVGGQILGAQQWRPELELILQIMALTAIQAMVMVTGAVVISSQTTSTRAANLLASFVIIPMALLVIVESLIMIQPNYRYALWYIAGGLIVVTVLLLRTGARIFNREELLGRALDQLNFRWIFRVFSEQWTGGVEGFRPVQWYRVSVFPAVGRLRRPIIVFLLAAVMAFVAGWTLRDRYPLPLDNKDVSDESVLNNLRDVFELSQGNPQFIAMAVSQNIRVLFLATLLSVFTFGVLGILFTALPFGIFGYVMGNISEAGLSPLPFVLAVIPHGIVEIPAIILAGAAALQLGAVVTRPPQNMTVGEAWVRQLADTMKIGIALVLPMLIIAGILEVQLTPVVVEWIIAH
ncbi:MAG TPA: stage II sporulation protein M [Aggregatilineales bacterium]|nr:stage II sporulation protein M [Aggregatilineales bacterium]